MSRWQLQPGEYATCISLDVGAEAADSTLDTCPGKKVYLKLTLPTRLYPIPLSVAVSAHHRQVRMEGQARTTAYDSPMMSAFLVWRLR